MKNSLFALLFLPFLLCCKKQAPVPYPDYFSIREYAQDHWRIFAGQPYTLERIVVLNGKKDSSMVSALNTDWGAVLKIFLATDIKAPRFFDKYRLSVLEENATASTILLHEALEPQLFTRKLEVIVDQFSGKIRSIYIETAKKDGDDELQQQLLYIPLKILQIQERSSPGVGPGKDLRLEYRFL